MKLLLFFVVLGALAACKPDSDLPNDPRGAPASGNSTLLQTLKPVNTNPSSADPHAGPLSPEQQAAYSACMAALSAKDPNAAADSAQNKVKCLAQVVTGGASAGSTTAATNIAEGRESGEVDCSNEDTSCTRRGASGSTVPTGNGRQTTTSTGSGGGTLSKIGNTAVGIGKGVFDTGKSLLGGILGLVSAPTGATGTSKPAQPTSSP